MTTIKFLGVILTITFLSNVPGVAQLRDGSQVHVSNNSRVSQGGIDTLRYRYRLKILSDSPQSVISTTVELGLSFPSDRLSIRIDTITSRNWGGSIDSPTVAPGLFRGTEVTWVSLDSMNSLADQFVPPSSTIAPGDSLVVSMSSRGLPCIARYWAQGWFLPYTESQYDSLRGIGYSDSAIVKPWYNDAYTALTVAPKFLKSPFTPLSFLDTLTGWVSQSRSQGWITTQPTADKYTNYFITTRSQLQSANIPGALSTLQSVLSSANADSTSLLTSEAYALIRYNTQYLITQLQPSFQVKGGIFNPQNSSTLSVRAKPDSNFTSSDTLIALTATVRWQSRYTLTLGTVSSSIYGFAKYGAVTTVGSYNYQQFRTTTHVPMNWTANTEYELFTVPVVGSAGVEDFQLTNALSGGQWFVDINYLDKTDSVFYQSVATCTGLAWQNKADNGGATFHNGSRHLAKTSTKLHEVYSSGGEILYRRKDLSASWEVTQRISFDSLSSQNDPCIIVAHDGSIHVVWQQLLTATLYRLWYNRSTNGGTTWGIPAALAQNISIIQDQWNIYPVIAEYGTTKLVAVWCTGSGATTGLKYNTSTNLGQSWAGATALSSTGSVTWYPSLVAASSYLMLTYDGRYNGVFSRIYNGTWQSEISVSSGAGTLSDRCSSVSVDDQNKPIAAWCAQSTSHAEYTIVYRAGNTNGSWGSGFVQFAVDSTSISDLYPSISYLSRGGVYGIDIIYAASNNKIKVNKSVSGSWQSPVVLSTSGQWANTSIANQTTSPGYPIRVWAEQAGSPYLVALQSDGAYSFLKAQAQAGSTTDLHRRVVVESQRTRSTTWFDLAPLKVVTTANDTVVVPFKALDMTKPFTATLASAWDYLGTDQITLPSNVRSLILDIGIQSQASQDSLGKSGENVFGASSFRFDGAKDSQTLPLLSNQPGVPGRKVIDVSQQAGQAITLRMIGTVNVAATEPLTIGVGDVYINRNP